MTLKLHCFGESGHSYKIALALEFTGLNWEAIFVDFFNGEARSETFLAEVNEMGECPVLTDGDIKLSQSGVILDYLADKTGKLGGTTAEEKREVLRWMLWDNHKMSSQAGFTRFLMNFLSEDKRPKEVIAFMRGRLKVAYGILDKALEDRDWLAADHLTIADLSCCSYLFYDEDFGFDRKAYPNIDAWLTRIAQTPGWQHPYDLMTPAFPKKTG